MKTKVTGKQNVEHFKMINWRLFIHKFCNNSKMLLSSSSAIFIRALVFSSSPRTNFSSFEYLHFSFLLIFRFIFLVHMLKSRKTIILSYRLRIFNYALLFVLIQQITVTFFSYSMRNYNAMTLEIQTKDNLWRGFFFHCRELKMSWLEYFLRYNKQGVWNKNVLGGKFSKN